MTIPEKILIEARQRGLSITPFAGERLLIQPPAPPDFVAVLRQHKPALLAWLSAEHLIRQVIAGEFDGASAGVIADIAVILGKSNHPAASEALEQLFSVGTIDNHNQHST
jgi:hypothetical protein